MEIKNLIEGIYSPYNPRGVKALQAKGKIRLNSDGDMERLCDCGEWLPPDVEFWKVGHINNSAIIRVPCRACLGEIKR